MIEATIADHSDQIRIIWFNQIYLLKVIKPGIKVIVKGKVEKTLFHQESQLIVQETEIIHSEKELKESTGVIIPIYPLTAGLYQSQVKLLEIVSNLAYLNLKILFQIILLQNMI